MDTTDFEIADHQLTTLDDNVNGIMSIIKLCQPRVEQALAQANTQASSSVYDTLFDLSQLLNMVQTLLLQSEDKQSQLQSFVEELQQALTKANQLPA